MNLLDFSVKAGFPISESTLEFLQGMMLQLQFGSLLGGNNYILGGCTENNNVVSDGWMVVAGEVLPFKGGAKPANAQVIVTDTATNKQFFGGTANPYYHARTATFGMGATQYDWTTFQRNDPANGVLARIAKVEKMLAPLLGYAVAGTTVYGSWLFWGRPASEIPAGWEPVPDADWKGKFPVVASDTDTDFQMLPTGGKTGGSKTHQLTKGELPAVGLRIMRPDGVNPYQNDTSGGGGGISLKGDNDNNGTPLQTENMGSGQAGTYLPPYKVVMFIRFAG